MQEDPEQQPMSEKVDLLNPQNQFMGKYFEKPIDKGEETSPDHIMSDKILDSQEEEDMKDAIPEGLDLIGLEDACTKKSFKSIPPKQIQLIHKALAKSKAQNLGVAKYGHKEKQKNQKDAKKKGRKTSLQRINCLGTVLFESSQYTQLTKFFSSQPAINQ